MSIPARAREKESFLAKSNLHDDHVKEGFIGRDQPARRQLYEMHDHNKLSEILAERGNDA